MWASPLVARIYELGDILEYHGFASVRTKNFGPLQWLRARR
jgi:hypothetical protein